MPLTFPTRTPREFNGGANFQSGHVALNVGFKRTGGFEITPRAKGQKARNQHRHSAKGEQPELEIVDGLAHGKLEMETRCNRIRFAIEKPANPGISRVITQFGRVALGDDRPGVAVKDDDPVGDFVDAGQFVRDDDEGDTEMMRQIP